jgi:hypothetical protein
MNVPGRVWRVAGTGLRRAMCWRSCVMRCAGSTGCAVAFSSLLRILSGSLYTSSADDACRSALNAVRMPRRTKGSTSVHCWFAWHMMAAFRVRWLRGDEQLSEKGECHRAWSGSGRVVTQTDDPGWVVIVCGQLKRDIQQGKRARATVSAVLSGIGMTSGQHVKRSTAVRQYV